MRNETRNKAIQQRMRNPDDELELVIVASMWLTGFDCPPLHGLYLDKPMQGAALMQALTRVNRPFRDKPAGLIVDYIGIAQNLSDALRDYTRTDQDERPIGAALDAAADIVREQHGVMEGILRGYDWPQLFSPDRAGRGWTPHWASLTTSVTPCGRLICAVKGKPIWRSGSSKPSMSCYARSRSAPPCRASRTSRRYRVFPLGPGLADET